MIFYGLFLCIINNFCKIWINLKEKFLDFNYYFFLLIPIILYIIYSIIFTIIGEYEDGGICKACNTLLCKECEGKDN